MSKNLSKTLGLDLPALAEMIRSKGRGKDTILAHITPKEAALLKKRGGRGSKNPATGLLEYDDTQDFAAFDQAASDFQVAQGGDAFYTPNAADFTNAPTDFTQPGSFTPYVPAPSPDPLPADSRTYSEGGGSENLQYNVVPAAAPAPAAQLSPYEQAVQQFNAQGGYAGSYSPPGYGAGAPTAPALPGGNLDPFESNYPASTGTAAGGTSGSKGGGGVGVNLGSLGNLLGGALSQYPSLASTLGKTAAAGGAAAAGANVANKAGQQIQNKVGQISALGAPYQQQGQNLIGSALRGELTPASQQAYNAARAQLNQGIASRGGVGVEAAANQEAAIYQTLLDNQYKYGISVAQIGDNYASGAITTGMQADQLLAAATQQFYGALANILGGGTPNANGNYAPTTQPTQPTTTSPDATTPLAAAPPPVDQVAQTGPSSTSPMQQDGIVYGG